MFDALRFDGLTEEEEIYQLSSGPFPSKEPPVYGRETLLGSSSSSLGEEDEFTDSYEAIMGSYGSIIEREEGDE